MPMPQPTFYCTRTRSCFLILDDGDSVRKEFRWFLQAQTQTLEACGVIEALVVGDRERPDATSDIRAPEKSGLEGLRLVRELSEDLPVTITDIDSSDTVWALRSGGSDYLKGPCGYDQTRTTDNRIGIPKARLADLLQNVPLGRSNRQPRGTDSFIADWTAYKHLSERQLFSQEGLGQPPS